jgi:hypothetical protein
MKKESTGKIKSQFSKNMVHLSKSGLARSHRMCKEPVLCRFCAYHSNWFQIPSQIGIEVNIVASKDMEKYIYFNFILLATIFFKIFISKLKVEI